MKTLKLEEKSAEKHSLPREWRKWLELEEFSEISEFSISFFHMYIMFFYNEDGGTILSKQCKKLQKIQTTPDIWSKEIEAAKNELCKEDFKANVK